MPTLVTLADVSSMIANRLCEKLQKSPALEATLTLETNFLKSNHIDGEDLFNAINERLKQILPEPEMKFQRLNIGHTATGQKTVFQCHVSRIV